ncbi:oligosaccharide flippase family protein [Acetanaerobacterium elongatum]|nr:oligosaccharide flippase family protein [Acetanaerobacterium elongatum]
MKIRKRSVFYAVLMFTASSVGLQLLGFIYRIALSRLIGAEGMGVYGLVMPVYSVVQSFALWGLTLALTKESAKYEALNNPKASATAVRTAILLYLLQFAIIAVPIFMWSKPIAANILGDFRTRAALLILLPCMCLTGIENLFKAHFQGIRYIYPPIVSELCEQLIRMGAVLGLLILFAGASPGVAAALIVTGMLVSEVFSSTFLSLWYLIRKRCLKKRDCLAYSAKLEEWKGKPQADIPKTLFAAALPVSFAGLLNNLLASATTVILPRRLMLAGLSQTQALSDFGIMTGMTMPLLMMPAAFIFPLTAVLVPKLAEACALKNAEDVRRKAAKGIHTTGIIAFAACAVLLPLGKEIAQLLYNEPAAGNFMAPLTAAAFFTYYQVVTGSILNGVGRQKLSSLSIVLCSVIHILFTWFAAAAPGVGMWGYVIGDLVSALFGAAFNTFFIVRTTGLSLRVHNWFIKPLLSFLAAVFAARISILLLGTFTAAFSIILSAAICLAVYFITLRFQGISLRRYIQTIRE